MATLLVLVVPVMASGRPASDVPQPPPEARSTTPDASTPAARGLVFATTHCSSCHAIGRPTISPNPEAPTFEAVVGTPGLTSTTLTDWLRDSHNYPEAMNLTIAPDQIDDLAAYMMTLRP